MRRESPPGAVDVTAMRKALVTEPGTDRAQVAVRRACGRALDVRPESVQPLAAG